MLVFDGANDEYLLHERYLKTAKVNKRNSALEVYNSVAQDVDEMLNGEKVDDSRQSSSSDNGNLNESSSAQQSSSSSSAQVPRENTNNKKEGKHDDLFLKYLSLISSLIIKIL